MPIRTQGNRSETQHRYRQSKAVEESPPLKAQVAPVLPKSKKPALFRAAQQRSAEAPIKVLLDSGRPVDPELGFRNVHVSNPKQHGRLQRRTNGSQLGANKEEFQRRQERSGSFRPCEVTSIMLSCLYLMHPLKRSSGTNEGNSVR
jgi:hypothetical protein